MHSNGALQGILKDGLFTNQDEEVDSLLKIKQVMKM